MLIAFFFSQLSHSVSFEEIDGFLNEICQVRFKDTKELPILVVGNKGDVPEENRAVSKRQAQEFVDSVGCPLVETSAKTGSNVNTIIETLIQEISYFDQPVKRAVVWKLKGEFLNTYMVWLKKVNLKWEKMYIVMDHKSISFFRDSQHALSNSSNKPLSTIDLSTVVGSREAEKDTNSLNSLLIKSTERTVYFYVERADTR